MIDIKEAFKKENEKAIVAFITAGDPTLADTKRYLKVLQESGVDAIELGIPFSDPIAEGVVIQEADLRALKNNVCIDDVFAMLEEEKVKVPVLFMTYANPVFFYGYDAFFKRCKETGVCGVIMPDVPYEENGEIKEVACRYGVKIIDMVAPVSKKRICKVCKDAQGFIYLLSDMGITNMGLSEAVSAIRGVTDTPVCKEFGSTPEEAAKTAAEADGVIIGSAIVKIIAEHGAHADEALAEYVRSIRSAIKY